MGEELHERKARAVKGDLGSRRDVETRTRRGGLPPVAEILAACDDKLPKLLLYPLTLRYHDNMEGAARPRNGLALIKEERGNAKGSETIVVEASQRSLLLRQCRAGKPLRLRMLEHI